MIIVWHSVTRFNGQLDEPILDFFWGKLGRYMGDSRAFGRGITASCRLTVVSSPALPFARLPAASCALGSWLYSCKGRALFSLQCELRSNVGLVHQVGAVDVSVEVALYPAASASFSVAGTNVPTGSQTYKYAQVPTLSTSTLC